MLECLMAALCTSWPSNSKLVLVTSGYTKINGTYELFLFDVSQAEQGINY